MIERYASGGPYEARYGYSRAVRVGDWVATAGCTAVVDGAVRHVGDPYRQAVTALRAGIDALAAAGARPSDVAQTRMYITDRAHADAVGRAHRDVLGAQCPAATMVVVGLIDEQMLVEVELVAMVGSAAT